MKEQSRFIRFKIHRKTCFVFQDLKDDISKAEMCAARTLLEKSTMMLLTTSKVSR